MLAGAREPAALFPDPDKSSRSGPDGATLHTLANPDAGVDAALALDALVHELDAPAAAASHPSIRAQRLDPDKLSRAISAFTPEDAIVVNEAATTDLVWNAAYASNAAPHTMLSLTGGAIGQGLPNALGAALACPDRRVIAFQAYGSGLYTLQALWSMAHESADVTVVVCANRRYCSLQAEFARASTAEPEPKAQALADLTHTTGDGLSCAGEGVRRTGLQRANRQRTRRFTHARAS